MNADHTAIVRRQDYCPPDFLIDDVELQFELDPQATRVRTRMSVRRRPGARADAALVLNGEEIRLVDLALDGRRLPEGTWQMDATQLTIPVEGDAASVEIVSETAPAANTALSGLYMSGGNFITQCEAEGFRRITFFADRPDVMSRYRVTLRAARGQCPILLSNGNLVGSGDCEDKPGWHWAT
ncbi:MAG: aminopeptidase N, partial [Burkholderiaceae bacterium]